MERGRRVQFLQSAHAQGWDAPLVRSLVSHYVKKVQATGGEVTDEMVEEFHKAYKNKLTKEERDPLVRWPREGQT